MEVHMTQLRKRMLEELQRRNYSPTTIRAYLHAVEAFARHFGKSPDKLDQEHLRQYQLHLLQDRKLTVGTIVSQIAALRFFFVRVLRRPVPRDRLGLSETSRATADCLEPRRSREANRRCKESAGLRDRDDLVCDRDAPRRAMPVEGRRC
jgi:hypothetical protein